MPYGIVKQVDKKYALVEMQRQEMCGDCHACDALTTKKSCVLRCEKEIECQVGDLVELSLAQPTFLKATYVMYGLPLIGLILGIIMGYGGYCFFNTINEDVWVLVGGLIGIILPLLYIKWADQNGRFRKYLPHIVAKKETK